MHKIIVAGCGGISDAWFTVVKELKNCEIVGLVDLKIDAAKGKKDKHSFIGANVYDNISSALDNENATLVFDLTTPESHYDIVTKALEAGCDVFGEKPMSDNLENAEKMVEQANKTGKEYFVMQNRRYLSKQLALKEFMLSGLIGDVGQVSTNFQVNPHFGGFRDEMESPLIADMAIHTFDSARFTIDKNAVSVFCHEFNPSWSWYNGDASAVCIFEMDDGIIFDYRGSWCANGINTSWESEWRIACADGTVFWDGAEKLYYQLTDGTIVDIPSPKMEYEGHTGCIREMFDCLESGRRPSNDCRDNIHSIRMIYNAIESSRVKKVIYF